MKQLTLVLLVMLVVSGCSQGGILEQIGQEREAIEAEVRATVEAEIQATAEALAGAEAEPTTVEKQVNAPAISSQQSQPIERCDLYSKRAVEQNELNLLNECSSFTDVGQWNSDYTYHYDWCIASEAAKVDEQLEMRDTALDNCFGSGGSWSNAWSDICGEWARRAVMQNERNLWLGCDMLGPQWSSDYDYQYDRCLSDRDLARSVEETETREDSLLACAGALPQKTGMQELGYKNFDSLFLGIREDKIDENEIEIYAEDFWQNTGVNVHPGERVRIFSYLGEWTTGGEELLSGAKGQLKQEKPCQIVPNVPLGGLIAKIGENTPFFVGSWLAFDTEVEGSLQLTINDCEGQFVDNKGYLFVLIDTWSQNE